MPPTNGETLTEATIKKVDTDHIKELLINFIVPLLSLLGAVLLFLLVIYPSFTKLPEKRAELASKQELQNSLSNKLSLLNKLVDFKSVVTENSTLIDKVLPSEQEVLFLSTQVNKIAVESGLKVTRLAYSYGGGTDETSTVELSLGAEGSYDQLLVFLRTTEAASRLVNVSTFRYVTSSDDTGATTLDIGFTLKAPYLSVQSNAVTDDPITLDITGDDFVKVINAVKTLKYYEITQADVDSAPVLEEVVEEPAL